MDVRHLLRIPEDFAIAPEAEDELECLNLEITCPPVSPETRGPPSACLDSWWLSGRHFLLGSIQYLWYVSK